MNIQPVITLNYQLSANDYFRAVGAVSSNKILSLLNMVVCILAGLANLLHAIHILPDESNGTISASDYGFTSLFCFSFYFLWSHQNFPRFSLTKRWAIARAWNQTAQMQLPINLSITETGVNFQIQGFQDFRQWQHYTGFHETKEMFLLYYLGTLCRILPKRVFSSPEQISQFRDLLREKNVVHQASIKMS
jgi:YcxB-like protein